MSNHPDGKVKDKYRKVYDIYRNELPLFFDKFELEGFMPFTINQNYTGSIYPFDLISQRELSDKGNSDTINCDEQQGLKEFDNELEEALKATLTKCKK